MSKDITLDDTEQLEKRGRPPTKEYFEIEISSCGNQTLLDLYKEILQKAISHI